MSYFEKEYSEEKRAESDAFLFSPETLFHVNRAYRYVLEKHGVTNADSVYIREAVEELDIKWAIDCEFAVKSRDDLRLTGRVAFRSRESSALKWGDVTISYDFEGESTLSEYAKTRANTGIYCVRYDDKEPSQGFAFFVIYHVHQIIHLLETNKIPLRLNYKYDNNKRCKQRFTSVFVSELHNNNCLIYAGVGPLQRSDAKRKEVLSRALRDCPEVLSAIELDGYWSAYPKPKPDPFDEF